MGPPSLFGRRHHAHRSAGKGHHRGVTPRRLPAHDEERSIRAMIERWTAAVHDGDLDAVAADHADDIVMFDVPPPDDDVRGMDAYRRTWPPFFEWQRSGAVFEIVS